jgi:monooxygenase
LSTGSDTNLVGRIWISALDADFLDTGNRPGLASSQPCTRLSGVKTEVNGSEANQVDISHVDVLIVGAGVSGIGAGYHLQKNCPTKTYAILEGREAIGGTWDLFRYPGIRSDSDMYTFGYSFKPWTNPKAIADGPSILHYVREAATENGVDRHIRFQHKVTQASWSSGSAQWTVDVERGLNAERTQMTCSFLFMCSGYYNYAGGYTPEFPGHNEFKGRIVHPQKWTSDIEFTNKKVIVIGSGATAVTLIPELAKTATHVTMLQRSPTFIAARPSTDRFANLLRKVLPSKAAYAITRWKNVLLGMFFFNLARKKPADIAKRLIDMVKDELGPDYDVATHFTPHYNPWEQRLCLAPDGDFFNAIKGGKAEVVTDHIERFTEGGIMLRSGKELPADLIVTATGLNLQALGGLEVFIDGKRADISQCLQYKGMMYSDIPNFASCFGYTNASWTLKADLTSEYLCRVLNHMEKTGLRQCTPVNTDPTVTPEPYVDFSSGYFQRSLDQLPKQGSKRPWKLDQNYALDLKTLRMQKVDDGTLQFSNPQVSNPARVPEKV